MAFLPIVERELRVASRRWGTYWLRTALAAFALLTCMQWFGLSRISVSPAAVGHEAFQTLSLLGLVLAFGACLLTADSVSHERREGTLGLLFLTPLKSRDIVSGKFAVVGFVALYALFGLAPAMMLSLVAGGVTGGEVLRMTLVLLNVLFLSLAAGLFSSVQARSQSAALFGAIGVLLLLVISSFVAEMAVRFWWPLQLSMLSPISGFLAVGDADYAPHTATYWASVVATHIEAWLLLGLAGIALGKNWRHVHLTRALKPAPPRLRRPIGTPRIILFDRANRKRAFAPVARAVLRLRGQRPLAWLAAFISLVGSIWTAVVMNRLGSAAAASVTQVFSMASSALFALVAGRFFLEARRSGELELLLVTPVGARGILREQRLAVLRLLMGPLYLVFAGTVLVAAASFNLDADLAFQALFFSLCNMAGAVLGVLAVCRVAMWFGTRVDNLFALMGCAVGLVIVLPTAAAYLIPFLMFGLSPVFHLWVGLMALLLVGKDLFFIWWAGQRLKREFRTKDRALLDRLFGWPGGRLSEKVPGDLRQLST